MITLIDRESHFHLENSNESITIKGELSVSSNLKIIDFSGKFFDTNNEDIGSFNYNESSNGRCNKSITNIFIDDALDVDEFLNLTINELKVLINEL